MDFLESLYSIDNFGLYLFGVIGILIFLFLLVLVLGMKDQKKKKILEKKLEETKKINTVDTFKENSEAHEVEVPITDNNIENNLEVEKNNNIPNEMNIDNSKNLTTNVVLNSELPSMNKENEVQENNIPNNNADNEVVPEKKEFDFDALADAISKELADIDKNNVTKESMPEVKQEPNNDYNQNIDYNYRNDLKNDNLKTEEQIPKAPENIKPKASMPSVFSSVYVNREKEEPKVVTPARPEIELPKIMDLPKKIEPENNKKQF